MSLIGSVLVKVFVLCGESFVMSAICEGVVLLMFVTVFEKMIFRVVRVSIVSVFSLLFLKRKFM